MRTPPGSRHRCLLERSLSFLRLGSARSSWMPNSDFVDRAVARRSELACPAHSLKMMAKAAASAADEVIFDLEDGCAPSQKVAARKTLVEAFHTLDFKGKVRAFRANGIHTKFFYRDVIEVVEAAGSNIDVLVLPKIHEAADVLF